MDNRVIIGGQWGDEGKGKVVDALSEGVDWVIRYQGGANAGHTIFIGEQKHVLHLVPSGILRPGVKCLLGGGMVIDPWSLRDEILALEQRGVEVRGHLQISASAHMLMPYHQRLDELREGRLKRQSIGTTGKGIGPAYLDKVQRTGMRMGDLRLPPEHIERKGIEKILSANELLSEFYQADPLPSRVLAEELVVLAKFLAPLIVDPHQVLRPVREGRETALFEGAQGTLLDIDHGTYPFVTSSNCTIGGVLTGTGLPPKVLGEIDGIFKAYLTRVGNGPFPTELLGEEGETLREAGGEYGATTGRARRCGWFDLPAARYAVDVNGITGVIITKLDVLDIMPTVKVATGYELDDEVLDYFPVGSGALSRCRPVYREFPGWDRPSAPCRALADLPSAARKYLEFLEEQLGALIIGVSVGREREQMIWTPTGVTT
ncbi:adenylosuccinate synthase [bacterium]|nr:adenylosuccinate synthase [bacterium]PJA74960.1 MAG: adenylosuccinate synthase [bacterium CG_4_9_14_3_um_filter_65_15]